MDGVDAFLSALAVERGLSANTVAAYRRDLAGYARFLEGRSPSVELVDGFFASLRAEGMASATVARKMSAVRSYHRFVVAEGWADEDPTRFTEMPKRGQPLPKALKVKEAIRLVEAPDLSSMLGRRDRSLLEVLYGTGARVSEVCGLDVDDLDLDSSSVMLTGKGSKQRIVPLGSQAVESLHRYLGDRMEWKRLDSAALFVNARGGRLTRQGVYGIVRRHADRAGIDAVKMSPHVLRHSAATHMIEGGADLRTVQEILGHASVSTTQVYTRMSLQHLHEIYVEAHPRS